MSSNALITAVQTAGSQTAFAKSIGASQQIVSYWVSKRKSLPAEYVLRAEQIYGIPRHVLRPDVYPEPHEKADIASASAPSPGKTSDFAAPESEAA